MKLAQNIQKKQQHTKFHMPGHKGRSFSPFHGEAWDTTELDGTDNLNEPKAEIRALEKDISRIYGSRESCIVVNGATGGLMAALMGVFQPGDRIIVPRNAHKSVYSGSFYGRLSPVFVHPVANSPLGYPTGISLHDLKSAMDECPDAKGLVVTYPSYYGTCDDLKGIVALCKERSLILIVDEAHGAHFHFGANMPISGLAAGADVVVHSTHKTLSSLSPGALLHINSDKVDAYNIRRHLSMLQTSSPSYPLIMSVAHAVDWMETNGAAKMEFLEEMHDRLRRELGGSAFPLVRDRWDVETTDWDPLKCWIYSGNTNKLGQILSDAFQIDVEWEDGRTCLAMAGVGSTREDYDRLIDALKYLTKTTPRMENDHQKEAFFYPKPGKKVLESYELRGWEKVSITQAAERISADFLTPYPPGIPLVCPGEAISREVVDYLLKHRQEGILGLETQGMIKVYKEDV